MDIEFKVQVDRKEISLERSVGCTLLIAAVLWAALLFLVFPKEVACLGMISAAWVFRKGAQSFGRYRALLHQQKEPDQIRWSGDVLVYCRRNLPVLKIPIEIVRNVSYADGVVFQCKNPAPVKLTFLDPSFSLSKYEKIGDFRLPFFSSSVQARLQDIVHANQPRKTRPL